MLSKRIFNKEVIAIIIITNITLFLFLLICTYTDLKTRRIPLLIPIFFGAFILIIKGINGALFQRSVLTAIIPGIVFILIAFITKEAVGYGDGAVIIVTGLLAGSRICVSIILRGLIFSAFVSAILLIFKIGNRQTRLPFLPFLLTAWGTILIG